MKKQLLFLIFSFFALNSGAQTISMIGSTSPSGSWAVDTDLTTTDNITYTLNNVVLTSATDAGSTGLKFRQDHDWAVNWGAADFPTGTAIQNGPNIMTVAGTYSVTFNRLTGEYSFSGAPAYPAISVTGTALAGFGTDIDMATNDGITYTLATYNYSAGVFKFRQDHSWAINWGGSGFPTGTGIQDGADIPIPAGLYSLTFNRITGDYAFSFVNIGILGTAVADWITDVDMNTTDGTIYTLSNFTLMDGELKFRQDDSWTNNWGGSSFPTGTGIANGNNIVATAGNYDISFNRNTLEYSFTQLLGINDSSKGKFTVYPNPTHNQWNFISKGENINNLTVYDMLGKRVAKLKPNNLTVTIDSASMNQGIYFAKIETESSNQTIKLIKE